MGYFPLLVVIAIVLFFAARFMINKMQSEKELVLTCVTGSKEPLKASQIGDSTGIPDGSVYRFADELVKEKRIGVMVTQDFIQGRRIRIIQYHALPS